MRFTLFVCLCIIFCSCTSNDKIDVANYPIVTTVSELIEYYDIALDTSGQFETTNLTRYIDGSIELEYTYDLIETEEYDPLYYAITVERDLTVSDAKSMYKLGKGAVNLAGNSFEQGTIEITDINLPGDEHYYALRTYEGEPNGLFFTMRKNKFIYTIIISGIYSDDHSLLTDLIFPKLRYLESFRVIK